MPPGVRPTAADGPRARVTRARRPVHGKTSPVRHDGAGLFTGLPDGVEVTRYHSLIVRDLPPELVPTAWTSDPEEEIVMALRHRDYPVYGVQFHPESVATQHGLDMLRNFLAAVREHRGVVPQ